MNAVKEEAKPRWIFLVILACVLYFTSYLTRLDFNAVLADIVDNGVLSKSQAGIVSTALFFAYGVGQLLSGVMGDKFAPDKLILSGLLLTVLSNILLPLFGNVAAMTAVWTVNGFAQALFWPPLVKILVCYLPGKKFNFACFLVTAASQAATIIIYLIVPAVILTLDWKSVFFIAAGFAAAVAVLWLFGFGYVKRNYTVNDTSGRSTPEKQAVKIFPVLIGCGIVGILIAIATQGFLKDGITTWTPTYISEVFHMEAALSIMLNVALPIFSIVSIYVISLLFNKFFRNEVAVSGTCFTIASALTLILYFFPDDSAALSLIVSALTVSLMHAINLLLISYVPSRFSSIGKVSTVSGITNAATYVGSTLSSYLFAIIAERAGWNVTVLCWVFISLAGAAACFITAKKWARFIKERPR